MSMTTTRTADAATEPVTPTQFEEQVIISSGFDANKVALNIKAARQKVEKHADLSLITQTWTMTLTAWPQRGEILLPKGPIQSITSLTYIDADGAEVELVEDTDFVLSTNGMRGVITPLDGWPSLYQYGDPITIVYVTGYGDSADNVPEWAKQAILAYASWTYDMEPAYKPMYESLIEEHRQIFNYAIND